MTLIDLSTVGLNPDSTIAIVTLVSRLSTGEVTLIITVDVTNKPTDINRSCARQLSAKLRKSSGKGKKGREKGKPNNIFFLSSDLGRMAS
jgi:hypothetical protein